MDAFRKSTTGSGAGRQRWRLLATCAVYAALLADESFAARGDLDPTFGDHGRVRIAGGGEYYGNAEVAKQADGKILIARASVNGPAQGAVVRLLSNGAFDPAFGAGGAATVTFGGVRMDIRGLAALPDGRILVAGTVWSGETGATGDAALAKLKPDGSRDPTFGAGGITVLDLGGDDFVRALAVRGDGHIVVGGSANTTGGLMKAVVAQLSADGRLDGKFGSGGIQYVADVRAGDTDHFVGLLPLADGRLVACMGELYAGALDWAARLVRFDSQGNRDASFAAGAGAHAALWPSACLAHPDGGYVIAGGSMHGGIAKFTGDGQLDLTFGGGDGDIDFVLDPEGWGGEWGEGYSVDFVHAEADGSLVAVGVGGGASVYGALAVLRATPNGQLDETHAPGGVRYFDLGSGSAPNGWLVEGWSEPTRLVAFEDGSMVVVGAHGKSTTGVRLQNDDRPGATILGFRHAGRYFSEGRTSGEQLVLVQRTGSADGPVSVDYTTLDGSAIAPADYVASAGTLTWADGDLEPKAIAIPVANDGIAEGEEQFTIVLSNPVAAGLAADHATATLNDPLPTPATPEPPTPRPSASGSGPGGGGAAGLVLAVLFGSLLLRFRLHRPPHQRADRVLRRRALV